MAAQEEDVYASLLLTDSYLPGALVLAHSLRDAGATKKLAILVTIDTVSAEVVTQLKAVYDYVIPVPRIRNAKPANLRLMNRPDLHSAFTKVNLWRQTQFRRVVYLDADVVAYRAPDELFSIPHAFAAAPDIGWPDLFNTGVMVLTPNMGEYYALMAMADRGISFDGADQGLLNMYFKNSFHRLSFTYNVTPSAHYQYVPAYLHFQSSINMAHFIGNEKPWALGRDASTRDSPYSEMLGRWWAVYDRHYRVQTPTPTVPSTDTSQSIHPSPPAELVQYFVKGEYQPTISYVVPVGEPRQEPSSSSHGQHYLYESMPPHGHRDHQTSSPHQESSQAGSSVQHHEPPAPLPSDAFDSREEAHTEAREEQAHEHPHAASPPALEHKPESFQPPPTPSWDAQWQPPPADAKPEAEHFPLAHYEMSSDPAPFVAPVRYPSPPKNMWYEVPKERPAPSHAKPKSIFPWETHRPRPSRVFANEPLESLSSVVESSTDESGEHGAPLDHGIQAESSMIGSSAVGQKSEPVTPTTPTIHITPSDPWSSFTRTNAWDDVPEIERYVDTIQKHRRTKSNNLKLADLPGSDMALAGSGHPARRGSKVTDFPSEVDRPSLPVTPAPIRRPKFWGGGAPGVGADGDEEGLPAAEGVPTQSDWVCAHGVRWSPADCLCDLANVLRHHKDPIAQLQKLAKQQSEMLLQKLGGAGEHEAEQRPSSSQGDARSPMYAAHSASGVLSPQPVKPSSSTRGILADDSQAVPRSTSSESSTASVPEPSYSGPGPMFEKGEDIATFETPALPSEEERDVLET